MKTHIVSARVEQTIREFLQGLRPISFSGQPFFNLTPESLLQITSECTRRHAVLRNCRTWVHATLLVRGVRTTFTIPSSLNDEGGEDSMHFFPSGMGGVVEMFEHHRPRKPLPFEVADPKAPVAFLRATRSEVHSYMEEGDWTSPARPVAAINALLKRHAFNPLTTAEGNELLALIDELVRGNEAVVRWMDERPSSVYCNEVIPDEVYCSCMKGEPEEWFEIYDDFYQADKLRVVGIFRQEERVGRALCWTGTNPDELYLDRVYAPGHRSTFDSDIIKAVKAFCAAEGITRTVFDQTADLFGLTMVSKFSIKTPKGQTPGCYSHFPYVDSLYYFEWDGTLRNYSRGGRYALLHNTDGGAVDEYGSSLGGEDDGYVEVTAGSREGQRYPENETRWVDREQEIYHLRDVSHSDYLGEYVVDDESVLTYDGHLIWLDDATSLHDGERAHDDDSDLVLLSNGEYAIDGRDKIIVLHDGTTVLDDGDLDWTTTAGGECALRKDCVEVDGVWYLEGREPAEETKTETVA